MMTTITTPLNTPLNDLYAHTVFPNEPKIVTGGLIYECPHWLVTDKSKASLKQLAA